MITAYFTNINKSPDANHIAARLNELPQDLKKKITAYHTQQRLSKLCGKLLLAKLLADNLTQYGLSLKDMRYNEFAKPFFNANLDFSIAHSGDMALCAVTENFKAGIDIEKIADADFEALRDNFSSEEWSKINGDDNMQQTFYNAWVRKEAVMKATGKGIFQPMSEINALTDHVQVDGHTWFLKDIFVASGYAASIATTEKDAEIQFSEIDIQELMAIPVR